jgi:heptosyltransferase-2
MKLLLIRFSSLGDVVLATAAANFIKEALPEAEITFLCKPAYAPMLQGHPSLSRVWARQGSDLQWLRRIRSERFDAVLDLQGKLRSRAYAAFSGSKCGRLRNQALERRLRVWLPSRRMAPFVDASQKGVQAAAQLLGLPEKNARPSLSVAPQAAVWASEFLASQGHQGGELVAISPGAAWATKRWHPGSFAQALGLLASPGRSFLFVGDARDAALSAEILSYARKGVEQSIVAAGKTDFAQLAALLARCKALLCNDSGPMHVAGALGVPVVAFFGPTVEAFGFYPRGPRDKVLSRDLPCRPCSVHGSERCPIGTHACMQEIPAFAASQAVEEALKA